MKDKPLYRYSGLSTKLLTSFLCFILFAFTASSQNVTGKVVDEDGQPIQSVSVIVKGTTNGTTTNSNGQYTLAASSAATLVFSSVGYITKEMPVDGRTDVDVVLTIS